MLRDFAPVLAKQVDRFYKSIVLLVGPVAVTFSPKRFRILSLELVKGFLVTAAGS